MTFAGCGQVVTFAGCGHVVTFAGCGHVVTFAGCGQVTDDKEMGIWHHYQGSCPLFSFVDAKAHRS